MFLLKFFVGFLRFCCAEIGRKSKAFDCLKWVNIKFFSRCKASFFKIKKRSDCFIIKAVKNQGVLWIETFILTTSKTEESRSFQLSSFSSFRAIDLFLVNDSPCFFTMQNAVLFFAGSGKNIDKWGERGLNTARRESGLGGMYRGCVCERVWPKSEHRKRRGWACGIGKAWKLAIITRR